MAVTTFARQHMTAAEMKEVYDVARAVNFREQFWNRDEIINVIYGAAIFTQDDEVTEPVDAII